jgi:hypothetical protein
VFWFSLRLLFKTFLILRWIQRVIVINVEKSSRRLPVILAAFLWNLNFLDILSKKKKAQTSNFIKIRPLGAEMFHADGRNFANEHKNRIQRAPPVLVKTCATWENIDTARRKWTLFRLQSAYFSQTRRLADPVATKSNFRQRALPFHHLRVCLSTQTCLVTNATE